MRTAGIIVALLLASALMIGGQGVLFEDRFIFFPWPTLAVTPAASGLPFEEARFGPEARLHGWFIPGSTGVTILWFHGNAGNISHRVELLERLHRGLGTNLFIFDYSGYGLSRGRPSEQATSEDARAALAYLRARPDVDAERIVYYGKSLGAAVAVDLASEEPPYRLIVQSAFTSIADMARLHYPFLPIGPFLRTRYATADRIGRVRAPVLIIHGDADEVVPVAHARRLYEAAAEPKRLAIVAGAMHNDVITVGGQRYLDLLREFIGTDGQP
jgi:fermentation-respiration switch protein FrsA (DUF1100 family)